MITGVIEAYKKCIRQVQLYGPTNFAPVINHVGKFAEAYQDGSQYFILLIITDGVITDMPQTKQVGSLYINKIYIISFYSWDLPNHFCTGHYSSFKSPSFYHHSWCG